MTRARLLALKLAFPSGNVLDEAQGIVGSKTLIVNWVTGDDCVGTKRYEPGETVPILGIESDQLRINVGVSECVKKFVVNHSVFSDWS